MNVVVVESPAKAKTINKYLGKDYKVLASYGHVRDLPAKDGSVRPDEDFAMSWETDGPSAKRLDRHRQGGQGRRRPDPRHRPGPRGRSDLLACARGPQAEAARSRTSRSSRVVFNAITKQSVLEAMAQSAPDRRAAGRRLSRPPRARLSGRLHAVAGAVAQAARRPLGRPRPVGGAAPGLRPRGSRSSASCRQEYWPIAATFATPRKRGVRGAPHRLRRQASCSKLDIANKAQADAIEAPCSKAPPSASPRSRAKPTKRNPGPPFTTSTLQQEASSQARLLGQPAPCRSRSASMKASTSAARPPASSPICAPTACRWRPRRSPAARNAIASEFGEPYAAGEAAPLYDQGQERPGGARGDPPDRLSRARRRQARQFSIRDQARLYELIWKRAIASQMDSRPRSSAPRSRSTRGQRRQALRGFRAIGSVVRFDGFLAAYTDGRPRRRGGRGEPPPARDPRAANGSARGDIAAEQHSTEPPPRYSEASLIKKMEELGIGRPSTYTAILKTLEDRDYVADRQAQAGPARPRAGCVTAFLESFFERYVEYDFTASLEEKLDEISDGKLAWKEVLRDFWRDFSARSTTSRNCASPTCSTRSTRCWRRCLPGRARTAPIRASARNAAPATCRSSSASSAPSSAARTIPNAATPASSATPPTATARARIRPRRHKVLGKDPETGRR